MFRCARFPATVRAVPARALATDVRVGAGAAVSARTAALTAVLVAVASVAGCASSARAPIELAEEDANRSVRYTVQNGDRLGDIALELTGELARWRDIAAHNGIDDPRTLRAGTVLEIPATFLPDREEPPVSRSAARRSGGGPAGDGAGGPARTVPVKLTPVVVNRDFELSPLDEKRAAARSEAAAETRRDGRRVRVMGSYFPKGVYAQPAVYSKLLMRVAPGTLFELEREVDDWYGVVLENGIGYLRGVDGRVLEAADASRG